MQYFGVARCPYCRKRVNTIRAWSLRKQGEYLCPRCSGISNIYLSPLIYVFAFISIFISGAIYFFHKFVLNDIGPNIALQVFIPFCVFFFLSIFMVYLKKPVIKTASRSDPKNKKAKGRNNPPTESNIFKDNSDEFVPVSYMTGEQNFDSRISRAFKIEPEAFNLNLDADIEDSSTSVIEPVIITEPEDIPVEMDIPIMKIEKTTPVISTEVRITDDFFDKYEDEDYINQRLEELRKQRNER